MQTSMYDRKAIDQENCLSKIGLKISPGRIFFLKFILEGYDGMAILTTIDNKNGLVEIKFPREQAEQVLDLLEAIYGQLL